MQNVPWFECPCWICFFIFLLNSRVNVYSYKSVPVPFFVCYIVVTHEFPQINDKISSICYCQNVHQWLPMHCDSLFVTFNRNNKTRFDPFNVAHAFWCIKGIWTRVSPWNESFLFFVEVMRGVWLVNVAHNWICNIIIIIKHTSSLRFK